MKKTRKVKQNLTTYIHSVEVGYQRRNKFVYKQAKKGCLCCLNSWIGMNSEVPICLYIPICLRMTHSPTGQIKFHLNI